MRVRKHHVSLTLLTAALVLLIAGLTGGSLVVLRRMQRDAAGRVAARNVLDIGRVVTTYLSSQPDIAADGDAAHDWHSFSRLVQSMYRVEDALQYVSVTHSNVVLFHEQTETLDPQHPLPHRAETDSGADIAMYPKVLQTAAGKVPVVVFVRELTGTNGVPRRIEVALRRDAVWREERGSSTAIAAMFRLTMVVLVISFGACTVLVVWMMRREAAREALRRREEHLAFSGVMANGIVHDFRNPMSALRLDVQMLAREAARGTASRTDRIAELAERIRGTLDRMDKVFEEFLYMSRPASDKREPLELVACARESLAMLAARFEQAGIATTLAAPSEPLYVLTYGNALRRALLNVLTNAEQFSAPGSRVTVTLTREGDKARIDVDDEGPGIPPRRRESVFEMFATTRPEGTGLGLFLARAAIERSDGAIAIGEKAGPGTRVTIKLPLARLPRAAETPRAEETPRAADARREDAG
jgi:signal transduction histidine kinase